MSDPLSEFHHIEVTDLKARLRESEGEVARLTKESSKDRRIVDLIDKAVQAKRVRYKPAKATVRGRRSLDKHEQVLCWSDVHAGEVVKRDEMQGLNEYNWQIMLKRHTELLAGLASYREHRPYSIQRLTVAGLGDNVSGDIHDELIETNEMPVDEAVVQYALDAGDWIEQMVPEYPQLYVPIVFGNHGRRSKKRRAKRKFNNADYVIGHMLQQRLRNYPSVKFNVGHEPKKIFAVLGRTMCIYHGDEVGPSSMVGVPWGGIIRHVDRLSKTFAFSGVQVDHFVCGHYHESQAAARAGIIVNGSIVGPSEYGLESFGTAAPPSQLLLTFNTEHGLSDLSFIDLKAGLLA